jgi:hypothetical protein
LILPPPYRNARHARHLFMLRGRRAHGGRATMFWPACTRIGAGVLQSVSPPTTGAWGHREAIPPASGWRADALVADVGVSDEDAAT